MRCAKNVILCKNKQLSVPYYPNTIDALPSDSMISIIENNPDYSCGSSDSGNFLEVVQSEIDWIPEKSKVFVVAVEYCPKISVRGETLYVVNEEDVRLVI